jgi:hypothetical protein
MRAQNPILRNQVFIPQQNLLIYESGNVCQQPATCVLSMEMHHRTLPVFCTFEYFGPTPYRVNGILLRR